jgi:hypothetical protein
MPRITPSAVAAIPGVAAFLFVSASMAGGPPPSLDAPDLAQGPYSSMHMLLQKTVLKVNVANIDVRVDKPTQSRFEELARGQPYSYPLDAELASAAIAAPLADRGYQKNDRLIYSVTPDTLRTVVVSAGGQVLLDLSDHEAGARRVVMASYFAPKSDTRELLIRSLLERR